MWLNRGRQGGVPAPVTGETVIPVKNLHKIFRPRRIALFGAEDRPGNLGAAVQSNLMGGAFDGVVFPIHPTREALHGVATYADVRQLPKVPDLAIVCNPAPQVPAIVEACGALGVKGVLVLSGGFRETGRDGAALEDELEAIRRRHDGMRILGPNSLGVILPAIGLNASHAVTMPKAGHLAFISESRALCNSVIDWATEEGIGFSAFVSTGNRLDIGFGDLIDWFGNDPKTQAIIVYLQSITHARRFMSAARAFAMTKPIVVYKAGHYAETVDAVASHTGDMVGEDAVFEAAFRRCGVVRAHELDDIFDVAEVLASQRLPRGARLGILSNAGGSAIIASDALLGRGGEMAALEGTTEAALGDLLPAAAHHRNPVDILDGAPPERYGTALELLLADRNVDAVLVVFSVQSGNDPLATARMVVEKARRAAKPVLAAWMGGARVRQGIQVLNEAGLPTHKTPEQAVRAFMHLVSYARNLESLYQTPRDVPVPFDLNRRKLRRRLEPLLAGRRRPMANQAMAFLKAYGIPVCHTCMVASADDAVQAANRAGFPVVLKVMSPQIPHKVEVGGVALDLPDAQAVRSAYHRILEDTHRHCGDVELHGVCVQPMVALEGVELILGAKKDPTFGAVIMVGMGGVATNVHNDRALGLPPLNERLVRQMLESLRAWPLLQGYRGGPPVAVDHLVEVIIRFSLLIADYPEINQFDINPLRCTSDGVVALDAFMVLDAARPHAGAEAFSHLAIRPYPEDFVRHGRAADGTAVTLRSVRAEDEPMWHGLVASSSTESIRFRFRSVFRQTSHRMAVEHCVIDHERQISIVAEVTLDEGTEMAGIAQLLADADHETAEFAVLVSDPWQQRKIGGMLLDYCLELAAKWGVQQVMAETDPQNRRMLEAFKKRGFKAEVNYEDDVVFLHKALSGQRPVAADAAPAE